MDNEIIKERALAYVNEEEDEKFRDEVRTLLEKEDYEELEDRFYQELEFGTAGLRGVMGGGTNRMNPWMVGRATQGLANYLLKTFPEKAREGKLTAVIAFDCRHNSNVFAEKTACILAANGIKAYLFESLRPTPELSFAIYTLKCDTGVVVTASHNPPEYNGYKVYWKDAAQITPPNDVGIMAEVKSVKEIKSVSKEEAMKKGLISMLGKEMDDKFHDMCKAQLYRKDLIKKYSKDVKIVYTPLHGTGGAHVKKVMEDLGFSIIPVPEQFEGNGNFPTVEKPNPEEKPSFKMAIELGKKEKADCIMANDPDADRFGAAFPDKDGNYVLINGNLMGAMLLEYVLLCRKEFGLLEKDAFMVKSIVTSSFGDAVCKKYNVDVYECLTGFKWIAGVANKIEAAKKGTCVYGYEESFGCRIEHETADKDGISAVALCAEMTIYWRSQGKSVLEHLDDMYKEYGYFEDRGLSTYFTGQKGKAVMDAIMAELREKGLKELGGKKVVCIRDILESVEFDPLHPEAKKAVDIPKSNVLQFFLEGGSCVSARPSGTEPKIKFYINGVKAVEGKTDAALESTKKALIKECDAIESELNAITEKAKK